MLSVRNLTFQYASGSGVWDVSLEVEKGQIFGLVGPNGAGKSTILRCCLGLLRPRSGQVVVAAEDGFVETTYLRAKYRMGYIPELPVLFDDLTAWDHMRYLAMAYEVPEAVFEARSEGLLRQLGLWEYRHDDPFSYSKGMLQKLSIACALLHDPAVICADEPFSGLDALAQAELVGIFQRLKTQGKAILLSTHNLGAAERLCDRYLLLYQGRLLIKGDLAAIRDQAGLPAGSLEMCFIELAGGRS